jgi:cytochrome c oxidase cbb3-type subunit III
MSEEQHDYDGIKYRDEKSSPRIFRILFTVLVVWAVLFMGYYLFSGWSSQTEADTARKALDDKRQAAHRATEATGASKSGKGDKVEAYIAAGRQLFANLCAACHGENGKGSVGPDLTRSTYKYGKARLDITKSITEGRPGGMPAFNSQIDHEKIESLVEYVLSLK